MEPPLPHPVEPAPDAGDARDRLVLARMDRCRDPRWHFRLAVPRDWRLGPQGETPPADDDEAILALFKTRGPDADLEVTGRWLGYEIDPADLLEWTLARQGRRIESTRHQRLLAGVVGDAVATWESEGRAFAGRFFAVKWGPRLFVVGLRTPREHYPRFAPDFFTAMASFEALSDSLGLFSERVGTVSGDRPVPFRWVHPVSWRVEAASAGDPGSAAFEARPAGPQSGARITATVIAGSGEKAPEEVCERLVTGLREQGVELGRPETSAEPPRSGFLSSHFLAGPARAEGAPAEFRGRVMRHPAGWFVAGALGPGRSMDLLTWMRTKRALDIATGTLEMHAPAPPPDWCWYVVEHSFIVRYDPGAAYAERLFRDGTWHEFRDLPDLTANGRQIASEEEAMEIAARLFAKYPELS